ncbi:hypothetical protein BUALT_Bualt01G0175600 [Buddleja alternifolia]|uniref:Homeobox domain-containing protein n=1 Tax=Buddleja alternifolia TaxID=168488 RepID=A0AAV6YIU6_9LAMI|nr:hypothetical protein BUALT_Bualt01G0175600 [Buddleja alternifolia]
MELGLSLGDARKSVGLSKENNTHDQQKVPTKKNSHHHLDFCMALSLINSSALETELQPQNDDDDDDNGSSENDSSGNIGLSAARGLDVNRLPAATAEEVSSAANSGGSPFQDNIGFGMYRINNKRGRFEGSGNDAVEASLRGGSDEDDESGGVNMTRKKLRLSKQQSAFLEETFKQHHTLNPKQKLALAKQLNLRPRQVEVWFQNRRARTKLKQTEVDCEYLKRSCETLTEENRRLHKELQELRALKTSNPFYMQLPATTLTMCPSCERVATAPPPTSTASTTASAATIPFPLTRPSFYPFSQTPTHPNQSAAS